MKNTQACPLATATKTALIALALIFIFPAQFKRNIVVNAFSFFSEKEPH